MYFHRHYIHRYYAFSYEKDGKIILDYLHRPNAIIGSLYKSTRKKKRVLEEVKRQRWRYNEGIRDLRDAC